MYRMCTLACPVTNEDATFGSPGYRSFVECVNSQMCPTASLLVPHSHTPGRLSPAAHGKVLQHRQGGCGGGEGALLGHRGAVAIHDVAVHWPVTTPHTAPAPPHCKP